MATIRGGEKLTAALREISEKVSKAATLRIGFLENASYPSGEKVALIASVQEFGAPSRGIPPRPFFRGMIAQHSKEWPATVKAALLAQDYNADRALAMTGEVIRGELQDAIRSFSGVPLAPATVAAKGFDKQLIDTGVLLQSVDYEVKE